MQHRHLNHQRFTPAAIDNIIAWGKWRDWASLRAAALADPSLFDKIEHVCRRRTADPYAQRHHFWLNYVREKYTPA